MDLRFKKIYLMREYTELDKLGNEGSLFNYIDIDIIGAKYLSDAIAKLT